MAIIKSREAIKDAFMQHRAETDPKAIAELLRGVDQVRLRLSGLRAVAFFPPRSTEMRSPQWCDYYISRRLSRCFNSTCYKGAGTTEGTMVHSSLFSRLPARPRSQPHFRTSPEVKIKSEQAKKMNKHEQVIHIDEDQLPLTPPSHTDTEPPKPKAPPIVFELGGGCFKTTLP